jgi:hypothetical protein
MCLGCPDCQPEGGRFIAVPMSDAEKKARLAEALRQNLRRRKAQARAQEDGDSAEDATQRVLTHSPASEPRS